MKIISPPPAARSWKVVICAAVRNLQANILWNIKVIALHLKKKTNRANFKFDMPIFCLAVIKMCN